MTPEEYQRIKEEEKEHLRKIKKLKVAHRQLERQQKVTKAVTDMTSSIQEKLDVHSDMMNQIATESAINEARLEMAIESRQLEDQEKLALEDELDLAKANARELIRRLKEEEATSSLGTKTAKASIDRAESEAKVKVPRASKSSSEDDPVSDANDDLPEKTIYQ